MTSVESNLRYTGDRSRVFGSSYKQYRLLPQQPTGATLTLSPSEQLVQWQNNLTSVFNNYHSEVELDCVVAAAGANDTISCFWADAIPFTRVRFIGTNEFVLLDLSYADLYSKVAGKASTPLAEYLNRGPGPASATTLALAHSFNWGCQRANTGVPGSYNSNIQFAKAAFSPDPAQQVNFFQINASLARVTAAAAGNAGTASQSVLTDQYVSVTAAAGTATATNVATAIAPFTIDIGNTGMLCQQAVIISATPATGAAGVALAIKCRFPLRRFADTILAMNKNLYFGQSGARLELYLAPLNKWCYRAVNAAGVADIVTGATDSPAITVSNIALLLAVEQNSLAKKYVMDQFNSGAMKFLMPYPVIQQASLGTGSTSSIQQILSAGFGKNLLRSYFVAYHATDANALCRNTDNVNGHMITQLQSAINVYQLQDRMIYCQSGDVPSPDADWATMSNLLRDSAYPDGMRDYKRYWCWIDNHSGSDSLIEEQKVVDRDCGFPLSTEAISYQVQVNKGPWLMNGLVYSIVQKLIQISPNGTMELR